MNALATPGEQPASTASTQARRRLLSVRGEPLLVADWHRVLMIHLEVDPARLQREVSFPLDLHCGRAFVSLVAFCLRGLRPWAGGKLCSWLFGPVATHDFLNVRTYVKVNGEPAIHFLAEWVSDRLAVALGPVLFTLPYRFGVMQYEHDWPKRRLRGQVIGARRVCLRYAASLPSEVEFAPCRAGQLEEWLMERYTAFNVIRGKERFFRVWHPPWTQCPIDAVIEEDSLLRVSWPWMGEARVVGGNFSPGLNGVWMGRPQRLGGAGAISGNDGADKSE